MNTKIDSAFKATELLIEEFKSKLRDALSSEDWSKVNRLDAYISGMEQIKIIFELQLTNQS